MARGSVCELNARIFVAFAHEWRYTEECLALDRQTRRRAAPANARPPNKPMIEGVRDWRLTRSLHVNEDWTGTSSTNAVGGGGRARSLHMLVRALPGDCVATFHGSSLAGASLPGLSRAQPESACPDSRIAAAHRAPLLYNVFPYAAVWRTGDARLWRRCGPPSRWR